MKILVVGCGKIGKSIISSLSSEGHDVVSIDNNSTVLNETTNMFDIMGVCGNAVDSDTLTEADVSQADLIVATHEVGGAVDGVDDEGVARPDGLTALPVLLGEEVGVGE